MRKTSSFLHMVAAFAIYEFADSFSLEILGIIYRENNSLIFGEMVCIFLNIISVVLLTYLYVKYIMKENFQRVYMGMPLPSVKWILVALIMPTAVCLFYVIFTEGVFYREKLSLYQRMQALSITVLGAGLGMAFRWGIIFQGLMLSSLQKVWGSKRAVLISDAVLLVNQFRYVDMESWKNILSQLCSVVIIGTALSVVTLETGSVWSSVVLHALYNILSGNACIFHISTKRKMSAIWNYTFESENWLLTGIPGMDRLDTALPAMTGFLIVIAVAAVSIRKRGMKIKDAEGILEKSREPGGVHG